ncbi:MAG: YciI family protein [Gemmatimonadota bacterium]
MRVMVFAKATEDSEKGAAPTADALEAFAAMDRFTEELVKAGVFIAGAGLKNGAHAKRIICEGPGRTVIDLPAARGDFLFRAGRLAEARSEFKAAATLTRNARERAFLLARADACD